MVLAGIRAYQAAGAPMVVLDSGGSQDGPVTDLADLNARLDSIYAEWQERSDQLRTQLYVNQETPEQLTFDIALGKEYSYAAYETGYDGGWIWESDGDATLAPAEVIDENGSIDMSLWRNEYACAPASTTIPIAQARAAAEHFFLTGAPSPDVRWRED